MSYYLLFALCVCTFETKTSYGCVQSYLSQQEGLLFKLLVRELQSDGPATERAQWPYVMSW